MRALFAKRGLTIPQNMARIRLVHLPGTDRRSELMIIYAEAITPDRLPADPRNGMPVDEKFPQWAELLLQHIKQNLKFVQ